MGSASKWPPPWPDVARGVVRRTAKLPAADRGMERGFRAAALMYQHPEEQHAIADAFTAALADEGRRRRQRRNQ